MTAPKRKKREYSPEQKAFRGPLRACRRHGRTGPDRSRDRGAAARPPDTARAVLAVRPCELGPLAQCCQCKFTVGEDLLKLPELQ